ncbi:MAG: hypothetical protein MZV65_33525 [Chromatiales bacterium]|nr:hypothetical protein [Chromatiales bacterium]
MPPDALPPALALTGPAAVRYPRGSGPGAAIEPALQRAAGRQGRGAPRSGAARRAARLRQRCSAPALEAGEALDATVVNMRFVKPLDEELVARTGRAAHELLVTIEENAVAGGAGSAVAECLAAARHATRACCTSACPTASSSTATSAQTARRSAASTRPASSPRDRAQLLAPSSPVGCTATACS